MISLSHCRSCCLAASLLAVCFAGQVSAENAAVTLPYETDFEAVAGYVAGPVTVDSQWNFDTYLNAEVVSFGASGNQSIRFTGGQWLWLNTLGLLEGEITWVDFYLKPVFAELDDLPLGIESQQSAVSGFVKMAAAGEVYAIDGDGFGSGQWLPSGAQTALTGNVAADWVRLTYRLDYATKQWDLFVDGQMTLTDLGFLDSTATQLTEFAVRGDAEEASSFDYFYAGGENPLYADSSNDGLPDAWLIAQGLSILGNQRDGDGDSDGLSNLEEYQFSTRADLADTDADGADDGVEYSIGIDPNNADTDNDGALDGVELANGIDPKNPDTDNDGAKDGPELLDGTNPLLFDTDGDGLADSLEAVWLLDPLSADPGLAVLTETSSGSGVFQWSASFTTDEGYTNAPLDGQQDWSALGDVLVAAEQVDLTDSITVDTSFERLAGIGENRRIWISFRAKLIAGELPDLSTLAEPAVAIWGAAEPETISIWDEVSQQWTEFDARADVTEWNEYALYFDYVEKQWLITQNGVLVAHDLSFRDEDLIVFSRFKALQSMSDGSGAGVVRSVASFDDLIISNTEPAGLDFDDDGLENSLERELGSNLQSVDSDEDGMPDFWEYENGLDLLNDDGDADVDGDGLNNGDELRYGRNPQLADVEGSAGLVRRDVWTGIGGSKVSTLTNHSEYPHNSNQRGWADDLDFPEVESFGNNYGQRIYGHIIAPETGEYTFWIAGDDYCEFWLSRDASAFSKELIVFSYGSTKYRAWASQSNTIQLEAGQSYFFELLHKERVGDDHVSVAWRYGNQPLSIITGEHLQVSAPDFGDLDQDGLPDDWEAANGLDASKGYGVNGYAGDFDGDGLLNFEERASGTNPTLADSDGDGYSDHDELNELFTDPNAQDLSGAAVVVSTLSGAAVIESRGLWSTEGTELYSVDATGSVSYALNFAEAGAYRLVVVLTEQNAYKSSTSTFEIRASLDDHDYGIRAASLRYGETAELQYYLPYLTAGDRILDLDWLNGFGNSFLRIRSIRVERIDGPDSDQNGIADWIESRADHFGSEGDLPLAIYASPFCFEGTSFAPSSIVIDSSPVSDVTNLREETVQQALYNSYYADIELTADEDRVVVINDQSGLRSSQVTLTWAVFNAQEHDFIHIRLDDSLLLTAIDPSLSIARPIELELTAPDGTVEVHSLAAEARLQALFDQAGDWQLQATLLPLADEDPVVYHSEIRVSSASLAPAPIIFENSVRNWIPSISDGEVVVESDIGLQLYEPNPGTMPRSFELYGRLGGGRLIARLPEGGAILSTTDSKVIRDYSRTQAYNQVVETFSDGTVMVSAYILLNEVPEGLSVDFNILKSGLTFDDGTNQRTVTAEDFDAQGRYLFYLLRAPGLIGGNCYRYWFEQDGSVIGSW